MSRETDFAVNCHPPPKEMGSWQRCLDADDLPCWKFFVSFCLSRADDGSAGEGDPGDIPDVTITLSLDDMNSLFTGEMSAFNAYMGGLLQVDGDLRAAMGLQDLFNRIQTQIGISV